MELFNFRDFTKMRGPNREVTENIDRLFGEFIAKKGKKPEIILVSDYYWHQLNGNPKYRKGQYRGIEIQKIQSLQPSEIKVF